MSEAGLHRLLLIATDLPARARIWGDGSWRMPEEREGLDWLTLARLLGWQVTVASPGRLTGLKAAHWIVVACDGALLLADDVARIERRLAAAPCLLVARAAAPGSPLERLVDSAGAPTNQHARALKWHRADGSLGRALLKKPLPLVAIPLSLAHTGGRNAAAPTRSTVDGSRNGKASSPPAVRGRDREREATAGEGWARIGDLPLVTLRPCGRGTVATLAVQPSLLRDASTAGTALLTDLLVSNAGRPVVWLDWQGAVALRMDDPGAAQNVWLESWCYPKLHAAAWKKIGAILMRQRARLSIAYVSGWVDDGDAARGTLSVGGKAVRRHPGRVHPSPDIVYRDRRGHQPGTRHDGPSEYRGIQELRRRGLADVELHGHTHMHPDSEAWAAAADRYTNVGWFREVGRAALPVLAERGAARHPLRLGQDALLRQFQTRPLALVSPGDEFTDAAIERAIALKIELVSSYYTAIRHQGRFAWSTHVCAPYLDEADAGWFAGNLPVVGYFHDRDLAVHGVVWLERSLAAWRAAGATRFVDFREVAAALDVGLGVDTSAWGHVIAVRDGGTPLPRPAHLRLYDPRGRPDGVIGPAGRIAVGHRTGNTAALLLRPKAT